MNDLEFKHHLKDLAHGHHHPEEHDWESGPVKPARRSKTARPKKMAARKTSRKK